MNERFLKNPNLPQNKITTVFAHCDDNALKNTFKELSIKVINTEKNWLLDTSVSRHADILANYIGNNTFLADCSQKNLIEFVEKSGGKIEKVSNIKSPYPNDCLLNFADIGDYIICNKSIMTKEVLDALPQKRIIDVKQGYSKCSVCIAKRNTIITDDASIYNAVLQYDINSLLVKKGSVHIEKYDYGFIGGCCGLIDKDMLLFNGDLSTHTDFANIKDFLYNYGVIYIDIKGKPLRDIGSIIPIIEKDGE